MAHRGPPQSYSSTETALSSLPPPDQTQTGCSRGFLPPSGSYTKKSPHKSSIHNNLFFQAVTTCTALPQAVHKDITNCRSLFEFNPVTHRSAPPFLLVPAASTAFLFPYLQYFSALLGQNKWAQVCCCGPFVSHCSFEQKCISILIHRALLKASSHVLKWRIGHSYSKEPKVNFLFTPEENMVDIHFIMWLKSCRLVSNQADAL